MNFLFKSICGVISSASVVCNVPQYQENKILEIQIVSDEFQEYAEDTYISEEIQGYCIDIGEEYGVCPELLMAMIEAESSGKPDAENGRCKGLMQIDLYWHSERMENLGVRDIYDPYGNILVGTDYLMELAEEYEDIGFVLMTYNGDSNADDYMEGTAELSNYADKILKRSAELERLHGK